MGRRGERRKQPDDGDYELGLLIWLLAACFLPQLANIRCHDVTKKRSGERSYLTSSMARMRDDANGQKKRIRTQPGLNSSCLVD